jgi:hypothetical protein
VLAVTTGNRVSTLEHLDDLDRLLRDVQAELRPEAGIPDPPPPPPMPDPPPPAPIPDPPPPPPPPTPALDAGRLQVLAELAAHLLAATRELLAGYERVLTPTAPPPRAPGARSALPDATVSAGPFPSVEAVRDFEAALAGLPGVRDVAVRAYQGTDRAIIEVELVDTRGDAAST